MELDKLKRAAEWMGCNFKVCMDKEIYLWNRPNQWTTLFNPHEESGRNYLVDMLRKLSRDQWSSFCLRMAQKKRTKSIYDFERWLATAPSGVMFKCLLEVI